MTDTIKICRYLFPCSSKEEVKAMVTVVRWVRDHCNQNRTILICMDSQSLSMVLCSFNQETENQEATEGSQRNGEIEWIPGHSDIPGNKLGMTQLRKPLALMT